LLVICSRTSTSGFFFDAMRAARHQSHQQAYAKYLETADGQTLYKASKIARFETDDATAAIQKSMRNDLPDTATARIAKCIKTLRDSAPYMSEGEAFEKVMAHPSNAELVAEKRREHGFAPIAKAATQASERLIRAANSLMRQGFDHDTAMRRVIVANPNLHARALSELADNDADEMTGVGKGNVRIAKAKIANDATERLQAIIDRLVASGMDGKAASFAPSKRIQSLWRCYRTRKV
jgi:hypothetical protein